MESFETLVRGCGRGARDVLLGPRDLWLAWVPASFDIRPPPELLRVMVATTSVSRHPAPDFLESGAALLLSPGVSTRTAAAVVMVIELCMETELRRARPSSHTTA
jgi:hypothetical protein